MDYEKATVNGAVGPRFVNPSVVARPDSEVATGKDTTPRYVGELELLLLHRVILMIEHKSHGYFIDLLLRYFKYFSTSMTLCISFAGRFPRSL